MGVMVVAPRRRARRFEQDRPLARRAAPLEHVVERLLNLVADVSLAHGAADVKGHCGKLGILLGSQVLTDHIKVCKAHPLRKAEADIALLRSALAGLIGVSSEPELRQMEGVMRSLPVPDADKAVSINAIHALLATITNS